MTSPVPPAPEEGVPVTLWRYATTDHHGYDVSGWTDRDGGTGVAYRALPAAAYDAIKAYAETGEAVEGVLIEANLDDAETTPAETVRALLARANTAKVLLKEARRYVEDNIAGRFVPSNGDAAALLSRIDAAISTQRGEG